MKLLLDTHVWLWWLTAPEKLGDQTREYLADSGNELYLSAATSWEPAIKHGIGRIRLPKDPKQFVLNRLERDQIDPLPITHLHALKVAELPHHHHDPFDRILIAQALEESLVLCSVDHEIARYEVDLLDGRT